MGIGAAIGDAVASISAFLGADAAVAAPAFGAVASDAALDASGALIGGTAADAGLAAGGAAGAGAGSAFGGIVSDAAGAATYGPTAGAFVGDVGGVADAGAGIVDAGADFAGGAIPDAAQAATYGSDLAPGVTAPGALTSNATTLGLPAATQGSGLAGLSPPTSALSGGSGFGDIASDAATQATYGDTTGFGAAAPTSGLGSAPGGDVFSGVADTTPASGDAGSTAANAASPDPNTGSAFGDAPSDASGGDLAHPDTYDPPGALKSGWNSFTTGVGNGIDKLGSALNSPTAKVLGVGVAGAGLLKSLLSENNIKGLNAENSLAGQAQQESAVLENYLTTGTLPPGAQAALDQATNSAITNLKASYAARGMPSDPADNTQLAAGIAQIQQNAVIGSGTLAANLYGQGVSQEQLAASLYNNIVSTNSSLNTGVVNSIGQLASSLGGGTRIQIGGTSIPVTTGGTTG